MVLSLHCLDVPLTLSQKENIRIGRVELNVDLEFQISVHLPPFFRYDCLPLIWQINCERKPRDPIRG